MMNLPLISVIVPVYNVEQYVEECVESLVAQDYPNLEIVVVDDGATDGSGAICDRFAETYENVTVYHKENGGLSDARNYGLAHSHGEWISFVESADYVSPMYRRWDSMCTHRTPILLDSDTQGRDQPATAISCLGGCIGVFCRLRRQLEKMQYHRQCSLSALRLPKKG